MYTLKTDNKFISKNLWVGLFILVFILFAFIFIFRTDFAAFMYLSKFIMFTLAFYLVINAYTTRFISQNIFLSTISFFYGLVNLLQGVFLALSYITNFDPHAPEITSKIYFLGRINFFIILVTIILTLLHKPSWIRRNSTILFSIFWFSVLLVLGTHTSGFYLFLNTDRLAGHIMHFSSNIGLICAGLLGYYFLYKKKEEQPLTHIIILSIFFACMIFMEAVNLFSFLPFTHSPLMAYLYKMITLYLLILAQMDCCILRPFKEVYMENEVRAKAFDETLKLKNESYDKLIEVIPDPVLICKEDCIVSLNAAAMDLFKCSLTIPLIGRSILSYLEDHSQQLALFFISSNEGNTVSGEATLRLNPTTCYDIEYTFTTTFLYEHKATIAIIRDVTQKKKQHQTEKALYEHQLRLNYFSNISHDIKTPINIIYSALQVQLSSKNFDSVAKYNTIMQSNCLKLLKMVNNLLDINKLDNDMLVPQPIVVNIISFIESLCELSLTYMEQKNITYIFDTTVDEKYVSIDIDLLERIIFNLLSNAIKYSPKGSTLFITLTDEGDSLEISIRDTGIGIPSDKLETIFERFITLSHESHQNSDSVGIGLSIVKNLLTLLGGTICCKSKVNEGSEFIITLPTPPVDPVSFDIPQPHNYSSSTQVKLEFCDL